MTSAIDDAGFDIRDSLHWIYGSGFPKSLDVSKAIDKAAGAEREVLGSRTLYGTAASTNPATGTLDGSSGVGAQKDVDITAPATDAAKQWSGFGTALKPAHEPIVVARKPLVGTVAANVLTHSTGALNIDGCRVGVTGADLAAMSGRSGARTSGQVFVSKGDGNNWEPTPAGRWPANLVFTHAHNCAQVAPGSSTSTPAEEVAGGIWAPSEGKPAGPTYSDTPAVWKCADGCPVAELDGQSGDIPTQKTRTNPERDPAHSSLFGVAWGGVRSNPGAGEQGGASRFFTVTEWDPTADVPPFRYVAKPSKRERNAGLDGLPERPSVSAVGMGAVTAKSWGNPDEVVYERKTTHANIHPTVKPVALMRWLVRLVTPPGGTVLDPFAGSGTTLVAATLEGFHSIGIELTDDYHPIIAGRIAWAEAQAAAPADTLFDPRTATA
jgi:site-specific DNA-methyltransferase (adenine-specific)